MMTLLLRFRSLYRLSALCLAVLLSSACVHEWPEEIKPIREVRLHVTHSLEWTQEDFEVSRNEPVHICRYHLQLFSPSNLGTPAAEYEFLRADLAREDFTYTLALPEGDYHLYAWSDLADMETGRSYFFDSSDFTQIGYAEPYNGNNDLRDAFRGAVAFTVAQSYELDYSIDVDLPMERPLARYEFISTDLVDFLEGEAGRGALSYTRGDSLLDLPTRAPEFNDYRVKMIYSGYMPSVFNNLINKPVDSRTGVSYDARITVLNEEEACLGFDHVMVNGIESSIAVALEIYDPKGVLIGSVNTINVPTKRSRNTTVRGRFLTSKATGGIGINPEFDGDYNIEI